MEVDSSFSLCGSALTAQRAKMDVITSNLANADVTRTAEGGPYRKKNVVLTSEPVKEGFDSTLKHALKAVKVAEITEDTSPPKMVHNPSHPDADKDGYVAMPNVNVPTEMADLMAATRAYEANTAAFRATRDMGKAALDLMK